MAETCSKLHVRNSVWTAPARADRMLTVFQKTHPGTTFLKDFGVILGAKSRYFGDFWAGDGTFFRRWVRSRCQGYGTVGPQPQLTSSQRSKSIYPARHMIRSSIYTCSRTQESATPLGPVYPSGPAHGSACALGPAT